MPKDVMIIGSCATRDAFEYEGHDFRLVDYFARSSFACSFALRPFPLTLEELDPEGMVRSQWQRRMVGLDISRELPRRLQSLQAPRPLVVIDLVDERFNLLSAQGTVATISAELQKTDCLSRFPSLEIIRTGTDEHFALWRSGFDRFIDLVRRLGMPALLNKVYLAEGTSDGSRLREPAAYIDATNGYLDRLYRHIARSGVPAIGLRRTDYIAAPGHRWGLAPFHYVDDVYKAFLTQLDRFLAPVPKSAIGGDR